MPRSPSTYSLPPGTTPQVPNTVISSSMFTAFADDVAQTFNTVQPIGYGGTNATNAADARTNLGIPANIGQMATVVETLKDFVVNGDFQNSQENVNNAGTANGYFGADQWATYRVTDAGVITTQRVAARTPAGGFYRYRVTITTPDASLGAGEYLTITQPLEGSNVQSFLYGTVIASAGVLRFGFRGPAGTYAVRVGNSAANRSFVALFTISGGLANIDTVQTISIPGDTVGTWLTSDSVVGMTLDIVLACGSTFQGATGWQGGNILGTSAVSNGMGSGGAIFELFDVGLKLDPASTGVYGRYEAGAVDAVYRAERYWIAQDFSIVFGAYASGALVRSMVYFSTYMAKPPTTNVVTTFANSATNASASVSPAVTQKSFAIQTSSTAIGLANEVSGYFVLNARIT